MIEMTDAQLKTVAWEKVTRGPLRLAGVESVATCRREPLNSDDRRLAVCGFNGMLRGTTVWYVQPKGKDTQDGIPQGRELCKIAGVTPGGAFQLVKLDPLTIDECGQIFLTLPPNCEPTKEGELGRRVH